MDHHNHDEHAGRERDEGSAPRKEVPEKRKRKHQRKPYKLMRGTRALSIVFTLITTFVASGVAIFAANTYYNLDTSEIVVEEVQRVTNAIRATSGIIIGGGAGDDPTGSATFEVASGDVLFSTSGSITQSGSGDVEFTGDVGVGGAPTTQEFEVADTDGSGIVAEFSGRVIGGNAVNGDEFVTLSQIDGSGGGGGVDVFLQGGNSFGALAELGTNDTFDLALETDGTERLRIDTDGHVGIGTNTPEYALDVSDGTGIMARFSGRVIGGDAVNDDEFVTKGQLDDTVSSSGVTSLNTLTGDLVLQGSADGIIDVDNTTDPNLTLSINDGTVTNAKLVNDSVTVTAGTGLTGGGSPTLGGAGVTLDIDDTYLDNNYFAQGGNSFGATAILGTNEAQDLTFETNSTNRMTIGSAGGVTVLSGNDFTVASGTASFGGDVNLTDGDSTIATTTANSNLILDANGTGTIRLANSSTGNIEFFDASSFIDSGGNLTIGGNFTLSGTAITADGELTVSSGAGEDLILDAGSGSITLAADDDLLTSDGFNLTEGNVFREVQPIFGFDVPVRCSTSCVTGTSTATVSRTIESYEFPSAYSGTTRRHNFTVRYADSMTGGGGVSTWNVIDASDGTTVIDSFTIPESPSSDLDAGTVYTTGDVASLPEDGTDWYLEVSVPTGETIQVYQVFLGAYDEIN